MKRKLEAKGTLIKVPPGNAETSLQHFKKRKRDETDDIFGEKGSNDVAEPKNVPKKKKEGQKNVGGSDHTLKVSSNQGKKISATELNTQTKSLSNKKKKKKRKSKNKYKELNLRQKAEQMAKNHTTSKDSLGDEVSLEHDSGSIERNVSLLVQYSSSKEEVPSIATKKVKKKKKTKLLDRKYNCVPQESNKAKNSERKIVKENSSKEVQSSPKKKVKKRKKATLLDDKYYTKPQEIGTLSKNEDIVSSHSDESFEITIIKEKVNHVSSDGKKKKKKKLRNNSVNCQTLPHSNETASCPDTYNVSQEIDTLSKDEDMASSHSDESHDITIISEKVNYDSPDGEKKKLRNNFVNCQTSPHSNKTTSCPNTYNVPQEIGTSSNDEDVASSDSDESHDVTIISETINYDSPDRKKKEKKKSRNNAVSCQTLLHSNKTTSCPDTSEFMPNGDAKKKNKMKTKKLNSKETVTENIEIDKGKDNSVGSEKYGQIDNDNRQDETAKKKKKMKKKENATSEVKDIISPKKTKMENLKNEGRRDKAEESEAEEIMFDGNEECSEEFNKDLNVLLSNLNFDQFKSAKKLKNKGNDDGRNSANNKKEILKTSNGLDSVDEEWDSEDDGKTTGVKGNKRKRDSAFEEVSSKQKKIKMKANSSKATEKPVSPTKKTPKFDREKLAMLLEEAASKEKERPRQGPQSEPDHSLKNKMEDRLMAARFR